MSNRQYYVQPNNGELSIDGYSESRFIHAVVLGLVVESYLDYVVTQTWWLRTNVIINEAPSYGYVANLYWAIRTDGDFAHNYLGGWNGTSALKPFAVVLGCVNINLIGT